MKLEKLDQLGTRIWRSRYTALPYAVGAAAVMVTALLANELHFGISLLLERLGGEGKWSWHHAV